MWSSHIASLGIVFSRTPHFLHEAERYNNEYTGLPRAPCGGHAPPGWASVGPQDFLSTHYPFLPEATARKEKRPTKKEGGGSISIGVRESRVGQAQFPGETLTGGWVSRELDRESEKLNLKVRNNNY